VKNGDAGGTKNKQQTGGQKQAKDLGYKDAPEGYHWRKNANGEPIVVRNKGTKGGKLKYDTESGTFKNAEAPSTPKSRRIASR